MWKLLLLHKTLTDIIQGIYKAATVMSHEVKQTLYVSKLCHT